MKIGKAIVRLFINFCKLQQKFKSKYIKEQTNFRPAAYLTHIFRMIFEKIKCSFSAILYKQRFIIIIWMLNIFFLKLFFIISKLRLPSEKAHTFTSAILSALRMRSKRYCFSKTVLSNLYCNASSMLDAPRDAILNQFSILSKWKFLLLSFNLSTFQVREYLNI